jgi:hypothetical protein
MPLRRLSILASQLLLPLVLVLLPGFNVVFVSPNNAPMGRLPGQLLALMIHLYCIQNPQTIEPLFPLHIGALQWRLNLPLFRTIVPGVLFLLVLVSILLTASGCSRLKRRLMVPLRDTRHVLLLRGSNNGMDWTMRILSVPLSNLLLFAYYCLWLSLMAGTFVNWIYKMLFSTVSLRRKCLCVSLLDLRILHTPVTYAAFIRPSTG